MAMFSDEEREERLAKQAAEIRKAAHLQAMARHVVTECGTAEAKRIDRDFDEKRDPIPMAAGRLEGQKYPPADLPNYMSMTPAEMLQVLGDDAHKWATAFCQRWPSVDRDLMVTWFANAIETSQEVRRTYPPPSFDTEPIRREGCLQMAIELHNRSSMIDYAVCVRTAEAFYAFMYPGTADKPKNEE